MFSRKTMKFLQELDANNNRDWFNANKDRYESDVRTPALAFIESMAPALKSLTPYFDASAKKVGGSLMRVYRDTRFGKDKTPYKTNIGIQFRHVRGKDVHAPGYYLHIEPGSVFFGAGMWHPEAASLKAIRMLIDEDRKGWMGVRNSVLGKSANPGKKTKGTRADFQLVGDSLKRTPQGFSPDHPLIDDLRRKDFIASLELPVTAIYQKDFHTVIAGHMKTSAPLMKFLCVATDLMY